LELAAMLDFQMKGKSNKMLTTQGTYPPSFFQIIPILNHLKANLVGMCLGWSYQNVFAVVIRNPKQTLSQDIVYT
jgi:hypothetical protein